MSDYTNSKPGLGALEPVHAVATSLDRLEPLVSPEQLRDQWLFGINMVSNTRDPITNRAQVLTDDTISQIILRAVSMVETDTGLDLFPVQRDEKHPFDRNLYDAMGYFQLEHRPASSVEKLSVTPANGIDVYVVPLDWVETAYLEKGQLNIVPLTIAFQNGGYIPTQSAGGAMFLSILGQKQWLPAFWQVRYTSGYPDGMLPRQVNELVAIYAAMEVLSMLAATFGGATSHSLGYDGISQSVSTPGPQVFTTRIQELETKRQALVGKLKARYGFKLFTSNI